MAAEIDLYDLLLRGDRSGDMRLLPEDVIFIPSVGPQIAASGSLKNPAIYELKNEKTIAELIQMAGGLTPTANRKRATIERIKDGISREVLDFALNADSMNAALQTLVELPCRGRRVAVLGDMAELGAHSEAAHAEVGRRAAELGVGQLFAVGRMAPVVADAARAAGLTRVIELNDVEPAVAAVKQLLRPGDLVLLKASRATQLERVARALRANGRKNGCSTT